MWGDGRTSRILLLQRHKGRLYFGYCHKIVIDATNLCQGMLFTKTQICLSCFGSTSLGHSASFQSSDGPFNLDVWLWFYFPLSSSHFIVLVHLGCLDGASRTAVDTNLLIRCISPMSSVSRLSHPFHLPVPPIWNLLLPLICLNVSLYICTIWPVLAILPSPLCS